MNSGHPTSTRLLARQALEIDPRHYDATVVLAELHIEKGRTEGDEPWEAIRIEAERELSQLSQ